LIDVGDSLAAGRFELEALVGLGGMARVFRARDKKLGVTRAVKVLDPDLAVRQEIRRRFEVEAHTMAGLKHPNVVQVYDVMNDGDYLFIVMELIDGPSVLELVDDGPIEPLQALEITSSVLSALTVAHANGVIHRDIKPHNILVPKTGGALVTDFGIARVTTDSDRSMTKTGTVMGTWAFMSPEQRTDAKGVDPSSDIYSTGATLYAMMTGITPPDLHAADQDPTIFEDVPRAMRALIRKATRYWPWERYQSAVAMKADVERVRALLNSDDPGRADGLRFQVASEEAEPHPPPAPRPPPAPARAVRAEPMVVERRPAPRRQAPSPPPPPPREFRPGLAGLVACGAVVLGVGAWAALGTSERAVGIRKLVPIPPPLRVVEAPEPEPPEVTTPSLLHEPPKDYSPHESLPIAAEIVGSRAYDRVVVAYRAQGGGPYIETALRSTKGGYRGVIPIDPALTRGIEYYIEARPYTQGLPVIRFGNAQAPHRLEPSQSE